MTTTETQTSDTSTERIWAAVAAVVGVSVLTAFFLYLPARSELHVYDGKHRMLAHLRFGWPFDWVSQNQDWMDPRKGNIQSFSDDIWQTPTTILGPGLIGNVLIFWTALAMVTLAIAGVVRTIKNLPG